MTLFDNHENPPKESETKMPFTVDRILDHYSKRIDTANNIAVKSEGRSLTWIDLRHKAQMLARCMRDRGVSPGDRVVLIVPNTDLFVAAAFAVARVGAAIVPQNIRQTRREMLKSIDAVGPSLVITTPSLESKLPSTQFPTLIVNSSIKSDEEDDFYWNQLPAVDPDQPFWFALTSGTTGQPKAAVVTHRRLIDSWIVHMMELSVGKADTALLALPVYGSSGLSFGLMTLFAGGCIDIRQKWNPAAVAQAVDANEVSILPLTATMFSELSATPSAGAVSRACIGVSLGSGLSPSGRNSLAKRFPHLEVVDFYGSTEMGPVSIARPMDSQKRPGTVGRPVLGVEVMIADESDRRLPNGEVGRVFKRGVPLGWEYWENPSQTNDIRLGEWVTSDDLGYIDDHGYIFLRGRLHDRVATGGFKVYPQEVEEILIRHPKVHRVVVAGVPDDTWGEALYAFVVTEPGADDLNVEDLREFASPSLSPYKLPKHLLILEELPVSALGKIRRSDLRDLALRHADSGSAGNSDSQISGEC